MSSLLRPDNSKGKGKTISVVTPCYNEEDNIYDVYKAIKEIREIHHQYEWEHIFIDNSSTDNTLKLLKEIAEDDKSVKIIVNIKNFGHITSPYHGYLSSTGDAVVVFLCDLQEPPELIDTFIEKWEAGHTVIVGTKTGVVENWFLSSVRKGFYRFIDLISETKQIKNFYGFGLYDKSFMTILRSLNEPYPYFRGLVAEYGTNICEVAYTQKPRKKGKSKNNLYTLYDSAALGLVSYSKLPLRLACIIGFCSAIVCLFVALFYFSYKLLFWENFQVGTAPLVIGSFFLGAVQLFFLGVIGEYIGTILTRVTNRPLVVERERINFDETP